MSRVPGHIAKPNAWFRHLPTITAVALLTLDDPSHLNNGQDFTWYNTAAGIYWN
jgi:hypothetical protein